MRANRSLIPVLAASAAMLSLPAPASADGLPGRNVNADRTGVTTLNGDARYVTLPASRGTAVARIPADDDAAVFSRWIRGRFSIPAVAYDLSASGLSADGTTLVLINPRAGYPRRKTTFAILDTSRLRVRRRLTLRGDFSFDAISPNGRLIYLIHYLSPKDLLDYEVRAFDLRRNVLLPAPIVDPDEPQEEMAGMPLSRVMSPDGRWAYTLYGYGEHPFVHALDTAGLSAVCIDLPHFSDRVLGQAKFALSSDGGELAVLDAGNEPLALIDTGTFEVSEPGDDSSAGEASELWWPESALVGALALITGVLVIRLRGWRRRRAAESAWAEISGAETHRGEDADADDTTREKASVS